MPKLLIFDAFTLLIRKKNVTIYALLRCKIFSLKIWLCKIFDKFHVWVLCTQSHSVAKRSGATVNPIVVPVSVLVVPVFTPVA